jgi:hypothetical protein
MPPAVTRCRRGGAVAGGRAEQCGIASEAPPAMQGRAAAGMRRPGPEEAMPSAMPLAGRAVWNDGHGMPIIIAQFPWPPFCGMILRTPIDGRFGG